MKHPDPKLKGVKGQNCNVTACQETGATFYNRATRKYYCEHCANKINWPGGRANALALFGSPFICYKPVEGAVEVENPFDKLDPEKVYTFEHIKSKNIFVGRGIVKKNFGFGRHIYGLSTEFDKERKVECALPEYLVAQGNFVIVKTVCYRHKTEGYCSKCADDNLKDNQV